MKKTRIAINGFGRIGRQVLRNFYTTYSDLVEIVAINDLSSITTNAHLLEFDTSYGHAPFVPEVKGDTIHIGNWAVKNLSERNPADLPWKELEVDVVIESTGIFRTADEARVHIANGAKRIIITAPAKGEDLTLVLGVNDDKYDPKKHTVISNASCTTNCLAPPAAILHKTFGIVQGIMLTVHSYTNDQRILDLAHKDLRRARAAACNIIPTTTGAAQAVAKVIPELKGKFSGYSLRVPTPTVSVVDFTAIFEKQTDTETLHRVLKEAADGPLKGIMGFSEKPLVSSDFKGDPRSSIIDAEFTSMISPTSAKILAWYDNEWGYSCRVADTVIMMHKKGI